MLVKLSHRTVKNLTVTNKPYELVDTDLKGFLLRIQPSGVMTYYYSYRNSLGKRQRYAIGRHGEITVTQARDIAEQYAAKVKTGIDVQAEKKQQRLQHEQDTLNTLGAFIEQRYRPWAEVERKSGVANIKRIECNFKQWYALPLMEITVSRVEQWCAQRRKAGLKATTINRDLAGLKAAISKAVDWEIIKETPLRRCKPLKFDKTPKVRYLSEEEEQCLRKALHQREALLIKKRQSGNEWRKERGYALLSDLADQQFVDHIAPMVLLSLNLGMRRGELFKLQWHDVNFSKRVLTVVGDNAKSSKTRHIPLNDEAHAVLLHWKQQVVCSAPDDLVFINKEGKSFDNVKKAWYSLLKLANIKKFRWHDMRHHFASKLVMNGIDLNTVRELLGHSNLTMTLRYAHLAPEHKAKAVETLVSQGVFTERQLS